MDMYEFSDKQILAINDKTDIYHFEGIVSKTLKPIKIKTDIYH